jgi:WD40 repeat protein
VPAKITFRCPCGERLCVSSDRAGQTLSCLGCRSVLEVPAQSGAKARVLRDTGLHPQRRGNHPSATAVMGAVTLCLVSAVAVEMLLFRSPQPPAQRSSGQDLVQSPSVWTQPAAWEPPPVSPPWWPDLQEQRAAQPSPLDRLDPARIPPEERWAGQPADLVAVIGNHRDQHGWSVQSLTYSAWSLAAAPDGQTLVVSGLDRTLRLWDLTGAAPRERLVVQGLPARADRLLLSPDGKTLALACSEDRTLRLWDLSGDRPRERALLFREEKEQARSGSIEVFLTRLAFHFSADGQTLESAVGTWDLSSDPPRKRVPSPQLQSSMKLWALLLDLQAFLINGPTLILGDKGFHCDLTGTGREWGEDGPEPDWYMVSTPLAQQAGPWRPGEDGPEPDWYMVNLHRPTEIKLNRYFPPAAAWLTLGPHHSLILHPWGRKCCWPRYGDGYEEPVQPGFDNWQAFIRTLGSVSFTAWDETRYGIFDIPLAGPGRIVIWSHSSGKLLADYRLPCPVHGSLHWLLDGCARAPAVRHFAILGANGTVYLFRLPDDGAHNPDLLGCDQTLRRQPHQLQALLRRGELYLSRGEQLGGQWHQLWGHVGAVTGAAFLPGGRQVLSAGQDGSLRCWDVESGQHLRVLHGAADDEVQALAVSPAGRHALAAQGRTISVWDLDSGQEIRKLEGHTDVVRDLACAADGRCRPALTARPGSGTWPAARSGSSSAAARDRSGVRPWLRTADWLPPPAPTAWCGCGIRPAARNWPPSRGTRAASANWPGLPTAGAC